MLIGIDWGGTKIEGVAMKRDGRGASAPAPGHAARRLFRLHRNDPRHDRELESAPARRQRRHRHSRSLEPVSRLGKGASSTWAARPSRRTGSPRRAEAPAEGRERCRLLRRLRGDGRRRRRLQRRLRGHPRLRRRRRHRRRRASPSRANNSGGEWGHNPLPFPNVTEMPGALLLRPPRLHRDLGLGRSFEATTPATPSASP